MKVIRWSLGIRWAEVQAALASFLPESCIHLDASLDGLEVVEYADGTEKVRCTFVRRDGTTQVTPEPVGPVLSYV